MRGGMRRSDSVVQRRGIRHEGHGAEDADPASDGFPGAEIPPDGKGSRIGGDQSAAGEPGPLQYHESSGGCGGGPAGPDAAGDRSRRAGAGGIHSKAGRTGAGTGTIRGGTGAGAEGSSREDGRTGAGTGGIGRRAGRGAGRIGGRAGGSSGRNGGRTLTGICGKYRAVRGQEAVRRLLVRSLSGYHTASEIHRTGRKRPADLRHGRKCAGPADHGPAQHRRHSE